MTSTKRFVSIFLCIAVLLSVFATTVSASENDGIAPCLNNTSTASTGFVIEDDVGYVTINYTGYPGITTGATIYTVIQKRMFLVLWSDVIEWTDNIVGEDYLGGHTARITSSGTYRAVVTYRIHGTGGADDVFTSEIEFEYK